VVSEGVVPMGIAEGPYQGRPNPHAWMSTTNALIYVENIRKALAAADPARADIYAANAKAYADKIRSVDAPLRARLDKVPPAQRWLVTSGLWLARGLSLADQCRPAGHAAAGAPADRPRPQEQDPDRV
jgi:ABC-type Zn uptake system ZnuABC Zn-binding protein ZnuA